MKIKAGGAIGPFPDTTFIDQALDALRHNSMGAEHYDLSLEYEVFDGGKPPYKIVPCTICRRPMVVNTFYVLAWAKCRGSGCSGESAGKASVGVAQAGRTEPATAVNLAECLINPEFANALCPVHPGDPDHEMELKHVHHNAHYGPGEWRVVKGQHIWVQIDKGETVMHQCKKCRATASFSTTAQVQFKRINEVGEGRHVNGWIGTLGAREEDDVVADD